MTSTPSPGGVSLEPWNPSSPSSGAGGNSNHASGISESKAKRYDRQLRLWGDHGQVCLERSRVCVINATATATEVLKNIVLPGVGHFTIVDGHKISGEDVGNNFFLDIEHLGQSRGSVATTLLLELNPDARGECVDVHPEQILSDRPDFFTNSFDLVIASNDVSEATLMTLSKLLWDHDVPLMVVRSHGLLGYIRIQTPEHTVVESHPDNVLSDLRLDRPFPALRDYMEAVDLDSMDKGQHSHTPYVVLLYKFLQKWKETHGTERPKIYKEKAAFKELLRSGIRTNSEGVPEDEENFEEAIKAVNGALVESRVPSEVRSIFEDSKCQNLTRDSKDFWVIARAVKDFVECEEEGQGTLPVRGSIPDMFSDSKRYIEIQNIYKDKAKQDAEEVHKRVQQHLESVGKPAESISENAVKIFCKEASNLRLIRGSGSIHDEYSGALSSVAELTSELEQQGNSPVSEGAWYYMVLRGVDRFRTDFSSYPGSLERDFEADIAKLKSSTVKVMSESYNVPSGTVQIKTEYVHEVCRHGGGELHAMAALVGGCAAQEAIKLLTKQYVPVNNLFIFNSMTSSSVTLKI